MIVTSPIRQCSIICSQQFCDIDVLGVEGLSYGEARVVLNKRRVIENYILYVPAAVLV